MRFAAVCAHISKVCAQLWYCHSTFSSTAGQNVPVLQYIPESRQPVCELVTISTTSAIILTPKWKSPLFSCMFLSNCSFVPAVSVRVCERVCVHKGWEKSPVLFALWFCLSKWLSKFILAPLMSKKASSKEFWMLSIK